MNGGPWGSRDGWREWLFESGASQRKGGGGYRRWNGRAIAGPEAWVEGSDLRDLQQSPMAYTSHHRLVVPKHALF